MNTESLEPPFKLLVVDDDVEAIRLLGKVLEGMGDLYFATSGAEALRLAEANQPDVVLLDAEMPDPDGFEVCRKLKADPLTADASVIFVTALSNIGHEMKALEAGAIDFIHKPISPPLVQARVRNHLRLKFQSDKLRRLASVDTVTGLANRRTFDAVIEEECRRASRGTQPLAVLMADVDCFKSYNDTYGHQAGDDCLRSIGGIFRASARRPGDTAARYGGEEFALILPDADLPDALAIAEGLCENIRALGIPHAKSTVAPVVTVSIGAATAAPEGGIRPALLVRAADEALYAAKGAGRNRVAGKRPLNS